MEESELRQTIGTAIGPKLGTLRQAAFGAAVLGLILVAVGFMMKQPVLASWLHAYVFWFAVTAGSLGLLLLHHTVGGGWGFVLRRFLESGAGNILPMAVLFLPLLVPFFVNSESLHLYEWVNAPGDRLVQHKSPLLNPASYIGISALGFLMLFGAERMLRKWGDTQDQQGDPVIAGKLSRFGAFGMLLYVILMTFLSVLWLMSLEPHWFSSIYGLLFVASQGLSTITLMLVLMGMLGADRPLVRGLPTTYFRDLGNLTLAMVMLWAYMSFSQYLITYSGNTAEEVTWYIDRGKGGWQAVAPILVMFHFFLPFLVLLKGDNIKKNPARLAQVAAFLIVMRWVDNFWLVMPTFYTDGLTVGLADIGAHLAIGGVWLGLWATQVQGRKVVPFHDPRLQAHLHEVTAHA